MAATPQYGTAMFKGIDSGKTYAVDIYISDVANAVVNFDSGSGASSTSLGFWKAPERVVLYDLSIASGTADTKSIFPTADGGQIAGFRFRYANFLNTLATRPSLAIGFRQGTNIGFTQSA